MAVIGTYWVGQIPGDPLSIEVRDQNGTVVDMSDYTEFKVVMLDSDNKRVDLEDELLDTSSSSSGRFVFSFPQDRSLFTKHGDYLFQLEMAGNGKKDYTSPFTMRVRKLGRKN